MHDYDEWKRRKARRAHIAFAAWGTAITLTASLYIIAFVAMTS